VSVPTTSVPILESDGAHASYYNNDCLYRHATRKTTGTQTAYDPQREICHVGQIRVREQILGQIRVREQIRMWAQSACVSKSACGPNPRA
jgi:hypothetical protein